MASGHWYRPPKCPPFCAFLGDANGVEILHKNCGNTTRGKLHYSNKFIEKKMWSSSSDVYTNTTKFSKREAFVLPHLR